MVDEQLVDTLRTALDSGDLTPLCDVLADEVQWYGDFPGGGCRTRAEVLAMLRGLLDEGARPLFVDHRVVVGGRLVMTLDVALPGRDGAVWLVATRDADGRIVRLQDYSSQAAAEHDLAVIAREPAPPASSVSGLVPFVHVRDVERSIAFYRLLGFEPDDIYAPEDRPVWASLGAEGARLMVAEATAPIRPHEQAVLFYLYARDLRALRDHLVAHDTAPGQIVDGAPGPRQEMCVTDPDGYCLMVAQIDE
jgi:catechol 2,3-dioxygenase-like lactoylglutathione lyase family enzyme